MTCSGIVVALLPSGRRAHSAFKVPINLTSSDSASGNINKDSNNSDLWDECTMVYKGALESLNISL